MKLRNRILALAAVTSLPLWAQQPATTLQPQAESSPQTNGSTAAPVPSTANSRDIANPELRPVTGALVNKLDSKNARTGDSIVIKTTEKATTASGVEIPKGSKIMGHVTDVEAKGTNGDNSRVTIQFDQAQIKGGQNLHIRSVIQSVAPPAGASGVGADSSGSGVRAALPVSSSGGMAGPRPSASTGISSSGSTQSVPTPSAAQAEPSGTSPAADAPAGTVVVKNGNVAIRTTAIPGVLLAGNVNGQPFSNAAGALLGASQNVHLDGGTVMVVAIAMAPASVGGR